MTLWSNSFQLLVMFGNTKYQTTDYRISLSKDALLWPTKLICPRVSLVSPGSPMFRETTRILGKPGNLVTPVNVHHSQISFLICGPHISTHTQTHRHAHIQVVFKLIMNSWPFRFLFPPSFCTFYLTALVSDKPNFHAERFELVTDVTLLHSMSGSISSAVPASRIDQRTAKPIVRLHGTSRNRR